MFRGQYEHTIDTKGRISVPARYREVLGEMSEASETEKSVERIILTRTFQQCLVIYPYDKWLGFEDKIRQLPQFNPHVQQLKRVYIAGAIECSVDSHGRLLVPQAMRDFAGLDRECIWVGQLDTCELWARDRWNGAIEEAMADPKALAEAMSDLGL